MMTATLTRDAYVDRLLSELTGEALEVIGPRVAERGSLAVELDLWQGLNDAFRNEGPWRGRGWRDGAERSEALLSAFLESAFRVAIGHGADGSFLDLVAELRRRFEGTTRQLRYRGLMRGPGRPPLAELGRRLMSVERN